MAKAPEKQQPARRAARLPGFALLCLTVIAAAPFAAAQPPAASAPVPLIPAPAQALWSAAAEYRFGQAYDSGAGVPQDFASAAYWYRRAAERGDVPAALALSRYYARGIGVPQDLIQAYVWANLAASRLPRGTRDRRSAVQFRDYVRFKLTLPQLAWAQQLSTGWPPLPSPDP